MDLLKRVISSVGAVASDGSTYLGSATSVAFAGASVISGDFPFILGESLASHTETGGIWSVYHGKSYELLKKGEIEEKCRVTIFVAELSKLSSKSAAFARHCIYKLKTLRHPGITRYIASWERSSPNHTIYLATEDVIPLKNFIKSLRSECSIDKLLHQSLLFIAYSAIKTITFLNNEALTVHSNLAAPERSVFVTPGGETRLFGFEASHSLDYSKSTISTESQHCANPDIHSDFWEEDHLPRSTVIRGNENETSIDVYMLGKMIIEIFKSYTGSILGISNSLQEICQQCNTSSVFLLPKLQACVEYESSMGGVGDLISLSKRLDSLTLMTNHEERAMLLSALATRRDEITSLVSKIYLRNKALPILGNLFSFIPSAISDDAVRLFLSISNACCGDEKTSTSEKTSKKLNLPSVIEKIIIILFETNDKSIRIALLESFPISILMELKDRTIQEKVYPPLSTGFTDVLPAIRHLTLKASVSLIEKFSSRQINGEIVKFYFRLQTDDQPGIRVNAMVCIAKVAKHLAPATATSLLCGAIVRALKDAFTPSRKSALLAAASFVDIVPIPDLASAFLPAICPALIDQALEVRVQAFKTISIILEKVEKYSSEIVDVIDRSPAPTGQYSISERLTTLVIGSKESVVSDPNLKNSLQNDRNNDFKPNEIENFDESNALPQNSNEFYVGIQQKKQILNDPAAIYHSTSSSRMTVNSSSHPSGFMLYKNISNVKKGSKTQFTASSATEYSPEKYHVNNPPQSQSSVEHVNNFSNQSKQLSGGLLNQRADESKTTVNRSASKPMQLKAVRTKNTDF